MNNFYGIICASQLLGAVLIAAQDSATSLPAQPLYEPVNIARIKAEYYQRQGFELLPEFIDNSTIGPGQIVAITNSTIRKGATLTVNPGTTIWFEPQRLLVVEGNLQAAATEKESIRLCHLPINMRYIKIATADSLWNGIAVEPGGSLFLNHISLSGAATGISVTGGVDRIDMACVDISDNVAVPVSLDGEPVVIADPACAGTADIGIPPPATDSSYRRNATPRVTTALRIGSCVITAGGIGLAVFGVRQYRKNALLYEQSTDPARNTPEEVDGYKKSALQGGRMGLAGGIVAVLGLTGVTLTFVF